MKTLKDIKDIPDTPPAAPGRSRLIQRLLTPYKPGAPFGRLGNAFAFGGGLVNGGFSQETLAQLSRVLRFDYMGAAEFEWGGAVWAIAAMLKWVSALELTELTVGSGVAVWVLAPAAWRDAVHARVAAWSKEEPTGEDAAKEFIGLARTVAQASNPVMDDVPLKLKGWLDIDNAFFFTVDKGMADGFSALLGLSAAGKGASE